MGYVYYFHKSSNIRDNWRCKLYRSNSCKSTALTVKNSAEIISTSLHSHNVNPNDIRFLDLRENIVKKAKLTQETTGKICVQEISRSDALSATL